MKKEIYRKIRGQEILYTRTIKAREKTINEA